MSWDPLPDPAWLPTIRSLHRWSQVVGKTRLALAPPLNHWWHVPLYVTVDGLTTSPMPYGTSLIELRLDLRGHALTLRTSAGFSGGFGLGPMSVADFYGRFEDLLAEAGVAVAIRPVPVEVADAIPFADDTAPGAYDRGHAAALLGALIDAERLLTRFRTGFLGKASPIHFFWGGFDLAATRFSGRRAPLHPGGVPNCPTFVMVEAYSHEVSSAGWWPGDPHTGPAFYSYMYPVPPAYRTASIEPALGAYDEALDEFVLPNSIAAAAPDPDRAVLAFFEATYRAGAIAAGWDRATLERNVR